MSRHKAHQDAQLDELPRSCWHNPPGTCGNPFHMHDPCHPPGPCHHQDPCHPPGPCPPHDPCHPSGPCHHHDPCHPPGPCPPHDPCDGHVCCDCCEVKPVIDCVKKLKDVTRCVFECTETHPSKFRELQIAFCILLTEISVINDKLDWIAKCVCKPPAPPCREEKGQEAPPAAGTGQSGG